MDSGPTLQQVQPSSPTYHIYLTNFHQLSQNTSGCRVGPEGARGTLLCYHQLSGHNPSLASHLEAGAKTSRAKTAVNNSHFHAGIYIHPMEKKKVVIQIKVHRRLHSLTEHLRKDLELPGVMPGQSATLFCCCCCCWSPSSFLPVFALLGSMPRRDGNHHDNMRQHSSLVYMHSSHQDCCLHFNRSTLVFATV